MLAKLARELPVADGLVYEPKWDGFRCIVFRDGDDVSLESRNERPLTRYFPELVDALRRELPAECVVDGEVVIAGPNGLDFDALLQRVHPAESRVQRLAPGDAGVVRRLRPARRRRHGLADPAVRRAPGRPRRAARRRPAAGVRHAGDDRPGAGSGLVLPVRGRGARRRRRQAGVGRVPRGQAGDGQGQARPDRGLRRRRLPRPQGRRCRLVAARPLRRPRSSAPRRRLLVVQRRPVGPSCSTSSPLPASAPTSCTRGWPRRPSGRTTGRPTRRTGGHKAGTRAGSRSGRRSSSRSPTTTSRATGSGTRRRSGAGGPTATRRRARTASSTRRYRRSWRRSSTSSPSTAAGGSTPADA